MQLFLGGEGSHIEIRIVQIFAKIFVQIRLFNCSKVLHLKLLLLKLSCKTGRTVLGFNS